MVRVRIAPSPTGIPHIGNTRTALFNYLFAKHNNGKFIVRIEDTDQARIVKGSKEAIFEILNWLGIIWDEEYTQSERKEIYKEHVDLLLKKGLAYEDEGAVRFKVPVNREISWTDAVGNKKISFKTDVIEDFVILKSDGFPTYHLANVVDDHLMNITHVIRGDEWISSTPKHILLYESFGWDMPIFAHLPVILGSDKAKLSKRHGAKSVLDYRSDGYLKEALLNFMVLLGWTPKENKEILSLNKMINMFDLKDVNTNSPIFDINKLSWFNSKYIQSMFDEDLISNIKNQIPSIKNSGILLKNIIPLAKTRIKTLNDFEKLTSHFFEEPKIQLDDKEKSIAQELLKELLTIEEWNNQAILSVFKKIMNKEKIRMSIFYKILTGWEFGLPLPESLEILGKEKTLERLKNIK